MLLKKILYALKQYRQIKCKNSKYTSIYQLLESCVNVGIIIGNKIAVSLKYSIKFSLL